MAAQQENKKYEYFAFISYCTKDKKWAKWFHRHLEGYHIPTHLCKEYPDLPKKIQPVFWYPVDLSGTTLKSSLDKELEASNYLIVICSPESAKSDWVNDEVNSFINKHGSHRIIPLIVAGEPKSSDPSQECFPRALRDLSREDEIRGISVPESGKYHALVDIVATMFNVRFDSLWQRHRRRRIRNNIIYVLLSLAALLCALFAFDYFRTSRSYYANYDFQLGMPVGIDPLKKSELESAFSYYVFESSRGKLRRVFHSNPFGHPTDENSSWSQFRTAILDIAYEGDKLSSITFSDANSNPLYKYVYSEDYRRVDIKDIESGDAASMFKSSSSTFENMSRYNILDLSNIFMNTKSQVARYTYDYDYEGYISKIHFKRYNGSNETGYDDNGICGIEYERDDKYRVTKKRFLDENGEYMADKMGSAGCEYGYNERGDMVLERFFDLDGNNQLSDMGYAVNHIEYDYPSYSFSENHFGTDGKPIMTILNYHKVVYEIKSDSLICSYFDAEQRPTLMLFRQRGFGLFHKSKSVFDNKGNNVEISFFGTDGAPCYEISRVHKVTYEYDDKGRCIRFISFNPAGERQLNINDISETRISYVEGSNNVQSIEFYRRPDVRANVFTLSKRVFTYSGNRIVKSVCYDSNDTPSSPPVNFNAHIVTLGYDDFGNVSDLWLYDASGTTQYTPDSYASHVKATYSNGNCVKLEYLNKHDRPVMIMPGYSAMKMTYDKRGRRTSTEYLDTLGQAVVIPTLKYASIESEYDPQGHEIEARTYDENHRPIVCADGWAVRKQEYKNNMVTCMSVFGVNDEPLLAPNLEVHTKLIEYDQSRRIISEKYLGLNNEPIMNSFGVSKVRYKYNAQGFPTEISTYNTHNRPVNSIQNFHKKVNGYDARNNQIYEKFLDAAGNLTENINLGYAFALSEYNPAGQCISIRAYGTDSLPSENKLGVHMILNEYTSAGDQILWAFLDKELKPVSNFFNNDYIAILYNIYDEDGRFQGFISFDDDFNELKAGIPIIENGVERGFLIRQFFTTKLRMLDGSERELSMFSDSPRDRAYIHMLDSISEATCEKVKRIIEEIDI